MSDLIEYTFTVIYHEAVQTKHGAEAAQEIIDSKHPEADKTDLTSFHPAEKPDYEK